MKKICFFIVTFLMATSQLSAQTWQWTHAEPNGVQTYDNDAAHDVETDAAGNVYVLGEYTGSLYLNNTFITSAYGTSSYLAKYGPTGSLLWYKLYAPTAFTTFYYYISATDIVVNSDGVYITGKYGGSNYNDYNCSTNIGTGTKLKYQMGSDTLVSDFNEDGYFITKMDFDGNKVWSKLATVPAGACSTYGPYYFYKSSVAYSPILTTDKNNNITASFLWQGTSSSFYLGNDLITLDANLTYPAAYIMAIKYHSNGNLQWYNYAKNSNGIGSLYDINSIAADNNGNIFLYGTSYSGSIFGPFTFNTSYSYGSTFIAKLSSGGTWQFVKELCDQSNNNVVVASGGNPDLITTDDQGNVYAIVNWGSLLLGTYTEGPSSVRLVKMNNNAELIWYKITSYYPGKLMSIKYANNSLYMSGIGYVAPLSNTVSIFAPLNVPSAISTLQSSASHSEYFTAKADTSGNFIWANTFSSSTYGAYGAGMGIGVFNDNVYTAGTFNYNITTLGNLNSPDQTVYNSNQIFLGKLKDQYIRIGAISAKQVIPGCSISIPFTSTGLTFSGANRFVAELSSATGDFTTPTVIGNVKSTGTGNIKATIPTTLAVGSTGYKIRIRSTDTLLTGFNYFAYADTGYTLSIGCPGTAAGLSSSNITGSAATLNWSAVGCVAGYKIQYRAKGTTAWTTVNTAAAALSLNITGLLPNTNYQWRIATKCKTGATTSFSAYSSIQQFKTAAVFASAVSIEELQLQTNGFAVYPNPAKQTATVRFDATKAGTSTVELADLTGRVLYKTNIAALSGTNKQNINLSNLAAGMYIITLTQPGQTKQTLKINKE